MVSMSAYLPTARQAPVRPSQSRERNHLPVLYHAPLLNSSPWSKSMKRTRASPSTSSATSWNCILTSFMTCCMRQIRHQLINQSLNCVRIPTLVWSTSIMYKLARSTPSRMRQRSTNSVYSSERQPALQWTKTHHAPISSSLSSSIPLTTAQTRAAQQKLVSLTWRALSESRSLIRHLRNRRKRTRLIRVSCRSRMSSASFQKVLVTSMCPIETTSWRSWCETR